MKSKWFFGLVAAVALLGGCMTASPYGYGEGQFPYPPEAAAPVQYAPPQAVPVQYAPPQVQYVGCRPPYVPAWNGCVLPAPVFYPPMYGGYYGYGGPVFVEPWLRLNINVGGGRHHRR